MSKIPDLLRFLHPMVFPAVIIVLCVVALVKSVEPIKVEIIACPPPSPRVHYVLVPDGAPAQTNQQDGDLMSLMEEYKYNASR